MSMIFHHDVSLFSKGISVNDIAPKRHSHNVFLFVHNTFIYDMRWRWLCRRRWPGCAKLPCHQAVLHLQKCTQQLLTPAAKNKIQNISVWRILFSENIQRKTSLFNRTICSEQAPRRSSIVFRSLYKPTFITYIKIFREKLCSIGPYIYM